MAIKLDENLSRHLPDSLRALGHDVHHVEEEGLISKSDMVVAEAARNEGRMLFTLDVEFADIRRHPPGNHPGIVLFRPMGLDPTSCRELILSFVQDTELDKIRGCVVIVEPTRVRIRWPDDASNQQHGA